MKSSTDPKGFLYRNSYDKDNRAIGTVDPLDQKQTVNYDAHGNVLTGKATDGLLITYITAFVGSLMLSFL